jgi:NADH-ubiquinone oxidoreductase chain 5
MSTPLMILAVFSIFFGYVTKDMFIGLGSDFFADNSLFIHPSHEIIINTEFAVPTVFKLLPLLFTISLSVIAVLISELKGGKSLLSSFKGTRLGYNIFGFFNQRFNIELFYNRYLTGNVLIFGGQTMKFIDKGTIELIGPHGLEKSLKEMSTNLSKLDTGVITSYALYILVGVSFYLSIPYIFVENAYILLIIIGMYSITQKDFNKRVSNKNL